MITVLRVLFVVTLASAFSIIAYDDKTHQTSWVWYLIGAGVGVAVLAGRALLRRRRRDNLRHRGSIKYP